MRTFDDPSLPANGVPVARLELPPDHRRSVAPLTLELLAAGVPENTRQAYTADRREWADFANRRGIPVMPIDPLDLADFVAEQVTVGSSAGGRSRPLSAATASRRLSAIVTWSVESGYGRPDLRAARLVLRGHRRTVPAAPRRAAPISVAVLRMLVDHVTGGQMHPSTLRGHRDRALLLLGFALGGRRSEIVRITVEDIAVRPEGVVVTVRRLKTGEDQAEVAVPYAREPALCPVTAVSGLMTALAVRGVTSGSLFRGISRSDRLLGYTLASEAVSDILQKHAHAVGVPVPDGFGQWSGHSLRRGMATEARRAGADAIRIARHGGWVPGSAALAAYLTDVDRWDGHALDGVL